MMDFKSSTQYGDWEGTAAADHSDQLTLDKYLSEHHLIEDDEFLIATHLFLGENNHGKIDHVYIRAYLYKGEDFQKVKASLSSTTDPIPVRAVALDMTLEQYIGLFKRFDVMLTWHGLELEGREFSEVNKV